jgi:hypothetical protein
MEIPKNTQEAHQTSLSHLTRQEVVPDAECWFPNLWLDIGATIYTAAHYPSQNYPAFRFVDPALDFAAPEMSGLCLPAACRNLQGSSVLRKRRPRTHSDDDAGYARCDGQTPI